MLLMRCCWSRAVDEAVGGVVVVVVAVGLPCCEAYLLRQRPRNQFDICFRRGVYAGPRVVSWTRWPVLSLCRRSGAVRSDVRSEATV